MMELSNKVSENTILCVDDDESVLNSLRRLFRRSNYNVITTTTGKEAIETIKNQTVPLIIVDQKMPKLDSVQVLEEVKKLSPDTIRIVLSSYTPINKVIDSINRGEVYRFITKPWDNDEVKLIVKEALERYEMMQNQRKLQAKIEEQNQKLQKMNKLLAIQNEERTQDLRHAQQILVELPVAVLGIDPDGVIVFSNRSAQELLSDRNPLIFSIRDLLTEELIEFFDRHCQGENLHSATSTELGSGRFNAQCQSLTSGDGLRGYIIVFTPHQK